jgi:transcription antitermination factor NusG
MKLNEIKEIDSYQPPKIKVGDEVKVGKFKNRKAKVKSITKDKNNQPVLKTDKGEHKLFKPRIPKLEDEKEEKDET